MTLAYAPPASKPVQDEAGNDAPAFSGQKVNGAAVNTGPLTNRASSWWHSPRMRLSGTINTAELGDLSSLQILYLWGNELSGAIPVELGKLTNLEQLSLSQNMLSGEIPAALGDLTSLQILYLGAGGSSNDVERGDPGRRWGT